MENKYYTYKGNKYVVLTEIQSKAHDGLWHPHVLYARCCENIENMIFSRLKSDFEEKFQPVTVDESQVSESWINYDLMELYKNFEADRKMLLDEKYGDMNKKAQDMVDKSISISKESHATPDLFDQYGNLLKIVAENAHIGEPLPGGGRYIDMATLRALAGDPAGVGLTNGSELKVNTEYFKKCLDEYDGPKDEHYLRDVQMYNDIVQNGGAMPHKYTLPVYDFVDIANRFIEFSRSTFKTSTAISSLIHLKREIQELEEELEEMLTYPNINHRKRLIIEYVDCFFVLISSFCRAGISTEDIVNGMSEKLEININRKWKDNGDGTYSHIKE